MAPQIVSPPAGAVVTSPFSVEVTYGDIEYCDTGGCFDVPAHSLDLYAGPDGNLMMVGTCLTETECPGEKASFEVTLAPGTYILEAAAYDDGFSGARSEQVQITVEVAATTGDTDSTTTASSGVESSGGTEPTGGTAATEGTATTGGETKDDGCGCRSSGGSGTALVSLTMAGLLLRRRRR